jgi:hypothetical protein
VWENLFRQAVAEVTKSEVYDGFSIAQFMPSRLPISVNKLPVSDLTTSWMSLLGRAATENPAEWDAYEASLSQYVSWVAALNAYEADLDRVNNANAARD